MAHFARLLYLADPGPKRHGGMAWARETADRLGTTLSVRTGGVGALEPRSPLEGPWDLILKVPHPGPRLLPWRLARGDRTLIRDAPAPVWFVRPGGRVAGSAVLAAVGATGPLLSPGDREALGTAAHLARRLSSPLVVVRPWSLVGDSILSSPRRGLSRRRYREVVSRAAAEHREALARTVAAEISGVPVSTVAVKGSVEGVLVAAARRSRAGILVLDAGAAADPALGIFGRLAERLLRRTSSSLLLSRHSRPEPVWPAPSGSRGRLSLSHGAE